MQPAGLLASLCKHSHADLQVCFIGVLLVAKPGTDLQGRALPVLGVAVGVAQVRDVMHTCYHKLRMLGVAQVGVVMHTRMRLRYIKVSFGSSTLPKELYSWGGTGGRCDACRLYVKSKKYCIDLSYVSTILT